MKQAIGARMLRVCLMTILLWPPLLLGQDVTINVRLVNGRNGKPIADENLNVFINHASDSKLFRPDANGIIKLSLGRGDVLSFVSNIQVTCHPYGKDEPRLREYQVSDILGHGVADQNTCSGVLGVKPTPGEFVFYERPRTFWEWMKL